MDEEGGDFVKGVEHKTIAPHDDGYGVVAECETVAGDKEAFRLREDPD